MESEICLEDLGNILENPKALEFLGKSLEDTFKKINDRYIELYSSEKFLASYLLFHLFESLQISLEWHRINSLDIDSEEDFIEDEEDFEDDEDYF